MLLPISYRFQFLLIYSLVIVVDYCHYSSFFYFGANLQINFDKQMKNGRNYLIPAILLGLCQLQEEFPVAAGFGAGYVAIVVPAFYHFFGCALGYA